uniref:Fe2OG dioxygenase domain-containing protein n=1 Tax=Peronospora matthiolae TaxID=2874970 RepID=A0AAV1U5G0_9STRA
MDVHQVPAIDIGPLMALSTDTEVNKVLRDANNTSIRHIVESVRAAASEWGFFYIANHGVSEDEMDKFRDVMRSFFRLSPEIKESISSSVSNPRGYVKGELTKNKVDWKECFDFTGVQEDDPPSSSNERVGAEQNQWLDETVLPGFRAEMQAYYEKMGFISRRLMKLVAVALDKDPTFFDRFFERTHPSAMRLNHYPVAPEPDKTMGVYHHTDPVALTILLQDDEVDSLQVLHRASGTWVNVPPRRGTYTINTGDLLQVWSNDQFMAPLHRVLASEKDDRFSAPFFYLPGYNVQVEPIVMQEDDVPNYRPFRFLEYIVARATGNYTDLGKENQIDDFRIHGPLDVANA